MSIEAHPLTAPMILFRSHVLSLGMVSGVAVQVVPRRSKVGSPRHETLRRGNSSTLDRSRTLAKNPIDMTNEESVEFQKAMTDIFVDAAAFRFGVPESQWTCAHRDMMAQIFLACSIGTHMDHEENHGADPKDPDIRAAVFAKVMEDVGVALDIETNLVQAVIAGGSDTKH